MIKVSSYEEAWGVVDSIFPTDYEKDEQSSERAGYPIYRSTADGRYYDYICDLNDRLEINLHDGNRSVNVWIDGGAEKGEFDESIKAKEAVKELGKKIFPLFNIEEFKEITLVVDGSRWNDDDDEKKVYAGLKRGETWLGSDLIARYCDNNGIKWGVIKDLHISHYDHGKDGENGGHFVVTAYVGKKEDNE